MPKFDFCEEIVAQDRLHGGDIRPYLKAGAGGGFIDFSANINPLGLSSRVKDVILKNVDRVVHYPEPDSGHLRKALASFHGVGEENIALGNGSIELIYLIPRAMAARKALIVTPTFSEYEFSAISGGAKPTFFETRENEEFIVDFGRIEKAVPRSGLVFFCNPNNPTDVLYGRQEIGRLLQLCVRKDSVLVVDEVFMDFVDDAARFSMISEAAKRRHLLVLRSLTKFFALPGLRVGYAVGHRGLVERTRRLQYPWNINSLAQAAAEEALRDDDYMQKSRAYISGERQYLFGSLNDIEGLRAYPPSSNFIFCKLGSGRIKSAKELNSRLLSKGMVIRDCGNFRGLGPRFFRVAVRKREENARLLRRLKELL